MKQHLQGKAAAWQRSSQQGQLHLSSWVLAPCSCFLLVVFMFDFCLLNRVKFSQLEESYMTDDNF
ncbi:unnamed protein product [Camellia sinensis]